MEYRISSTEIDNNYKFFIESTIDWKKKLFLEKEFFEYLFKKNNIKNVLELKSGTGNYILSLYGLYELGVGIDSDNFLIEKASEKSKEKPNVKFINSNFQKNKANLLKNNLPSKYDAIMYMNNGLSTIINKKNIIEHLKSIYDFTSNEGIAIFNIFNYNNLLKHTKYEFKNMNFEHLGNKYILIRNMKIIDEDLISYTSDIYDYSGHIIHEHKELQYPLTKKRIQTFLISAGFKNVEIYGDFNFSDFNVDNSKKMVVIAHK